MYRISPSRFDRNSICTASLKKEFEYKKEDSSNVYSQLGLTAHNFAADILKLNFLHNKKIEEDGEDKVEINLQDMITHVLNYCEYVKNLSDDINFIFIEKKVDLNFLIPNKDSIESYGTADAIVYNKLDKQLHVVDLKYGKTKVKVKKNSQLILYALGAKKLLQDNFNVEIESIVIHIFQPRLLNAPTTKYELNKGDEEEMIKKVHDTAINSINNPKYEAKGGHCWWCEAKDHCTAFQERKKENKILKLKKEFKDE